MLSHVYLFASYSTILRHDFTGKAKQLASPLCNPILIRVGRGGGGGVVGGRERVEPGLPAAIQWRKIRHLENIQRHWYS